jgi:hypothetical protein
MKLWRPSPLGPRNRAPATDTATANTWGVTFAVMLQIPPRATEALVVVAAPGEAFSGAGSVAGGLRSISGRVAPAVHALLILRSRPAYAISCG